MAQLIISDNLYQQLQETAQTNNQSIESLIESRFPTNNLPIEPELGLSLLSSYSRITIDAMQTIVYANESAAKLFAYDIDELIGQPFERLFPNNNENIHEAYIQAFLADDSHKHSIKELTDIQAQRKDSQYFATHISMLKYFDGNEVFISLIIQDTSFLQNIVRKFNEQKLILEHDQHVKEIQAEFLSQISHELRTPISIITTSIGLLRLYHPKMTSVEIIERLRHIEFSIKRLNSIISDIDVVNKLEQFPQRIQSTEICLSRFFSEIIDELKVIYPNKGPIYLQSSTVSSKPVLDQHLLEYIFLNLLSNALKYSLDNVPVYIRYECLDSQLIVTIEDNGVGIPNEDLAHVFEPFFRAANVKEIEGTGLGLAIVKRVVELLHGTISCKSIERVGTAFVITLPLIMDLKLR